MYEAGYNHPVKEADLKSFSLCTIVRISFFLLVWSATLEALWAQGCSGQQASIELSRSKVKADQDSIRKLGLGITDRDLEEAASVAEEQRKKAVLAAALSLVDGALSAPESALTNQSIADYKLKNGLGSLGTGQANSLIGKIRAEGGVKQALIPAIQRLSSISDKASKLEYLEALTGAASRLKAAAELELDQNSLDEASALFGLAAAIVGKGDLAVSLGAAVTNSAYNQTQIYLMAKSIDALTKANEAQLSALKVLGAKLQQDVQGLQGAKTQLADCLQKPKPTSRQCRTDSDACEKGCLSEVWKSNAGVLASSACMTKCDSAYRGCAAGSQAK